MKKKFFALLGATVLTLGVSACNDVSSTPASSSQTTQNPTSARVQRYTVAFEVDGERYKTISVEEGKTIEESIPTPKKEGYSFDGWYLDGEKVDLSTYVVTKSVTFVAQFVVEQDEDVLNVDDVKDATKTYHLVLGWWEVNDPAEPDKVTSGLTKDSVRLFYGNLIKYLKKTGSTDDQINAISFRNYSTASVAEMGAKVNEDADVDILIGVGANVFTTAGVQPYVDSATSKFSTKMGEADKERYVALVKDARDLGATVYEWLQTDAGKKSFLAELTDQEIEESLAPVTINLSVTVHGDTNITTLLDSEDKVVEMPVITVPETKLFKGFATSENGELALEVAKDATLKYNDLKSLVAENATTLDLYPVLEDRPVAQDDLVVYIQTHATRLPEYEANLLVSRYTSTLNDKNVKFNFVTADAAGFTAAVTADATADVVIGGNNPLSNYAAYDGLGVANAGAKHFKDTSRKVAVLASANPSHIELATDFYNFVKAEATNFEVHTTFWTKNNEWVTADEVAAIKTGIEANVKTYLNVTGEETLLDKYNVTITYYEATNTKVADLGAETNALREGKGTDLIVGCGSNVFTTGSINGVEKKDIKTSLVAANRQVALVKDNALTRNIYDTYFAAE